MNGLLIVNDGMAKMNSLVSFVNGGMVLENDNMPSQ